MNDFDCKRTFPHAGTLIFLIFSCSRGRERLFLLFFLVPACGKPHFFRFCLFPGAGTSFFQKSGCSQGRERGVFYNPSRILWERLHYISCLILSTSYNFYALAVYIEQPSDLKSRRGTGPVPARLINATYISPPAISTE
mgnify:CR=1 FL=1